MTHNLEIKILLSKKGGDRFRCGGEKDTDEEKADEGGRGKEGDCRKFSVHTNVSPWGERPSKLQISTQSRNSEKLDCTKAYKLTSRILYHGILLHITYLFLIVISRLTCNSLLKPSEVLNVKISSASLVYIYYVFRPILVIFR
jgi:hypothetical protein